MLYMSEAVPKGEHMDNKDTKYTSGPWFQCDHALWNCATTGPDGTGEIVATVNIGRGDTKNIRATAKLIAAAPDLLAALKAVLASGLNGGNNVRLAFIAASRNSLDAESLAQADASEAAVVSARAAIAKAEGR